MRTDQPIEWQIACFVAIVHGAATEVESGRLDEAEAGGLVLSTLRSVLRQD